MLFRSPHSLPAPPSRAPPVPKKSSPLVIALVALLGVGALGTLGAAAYLWQQRGAAAAPSTSTLDAPLGASGVELLDTVDGGDAGPRTVKRAGAAKPAGGDAGPEWMTEVKKAQKAQEDAEKAKAAADALKQKWGVNQ